MSATDKQNLNWGAISQAIAAGIIPAPVSSDENGFPIWGIGGKRISWQQIQQYVWEHAQQVQKSASTGGIEGLPQMPVFNEMPLTQLESKLETAEQQTERSTERPTQDSSEHQKPSTQVSDSPAVTKPKYQLPKLVGRSPKLETVDTTDAESMLNFVNAHSQKGPKDDSNLYLAEFLKRILKIVTAASA